MILEILKDVFRDTVMITAFVLIIMLFIEVLNIATQGAWSRQLLKRPAVQVLVAAILGSIPGCFGGFATVSIYTHGILSFGALLAGMITNIGDEAFVMLVQMPRETWLLMLGLFVLAMLVGLLCNRFLHRPSPHTQDLQHFSLHAHEDDDLRDMARHWKEHLRKMTFTRALLIFGILLFVITLALGGFEHSPTDVSSPSLKLPLDESWFNSIFYVLAVLVLLTVICVSDHFLEHHLWEHVIRSHFLKIFLWTFAALLLIQVIDIWVDAVVWIGKNPMVLLGLALLVGLIPESGPHLVFIGLFVSGHIPFAILVANSIVQDGHSALPLFAESKKTFFTMKLVKAVLAFCIGWLML